MFGLDALGQAVVPVVLEQRDAVELETLIEHFECVNDRRTVSAVLAQPSARVRVGLEQGVVTSERIRVKLFGLPASSGGDRVVKQHEDDAEQEGDDHRRK